MFVPIGRNTFTYHHNLKKREGKVVDAAAAADAKSLQSCPTLFDPIDGSPPGSHPWDSPGKNTGAGCHFLLQCRKVKSESEVAQSCPTFSDPMDCIPPGSSVHGIFRARVLEWGAIVFSGKSAISPLKDKRPLESQEGSTYEWSPGRCE